MEIKKAWRVIFDREIENAEAARALGNEGKARVCARRAAGAVAGEYFARLGAPSGSPSAYQNLQRLRDHAEIPAHIRQITDHFLERINEAHGLPSDADLIADAHRLANELLMETRLGRNTD